MNRERKGKAVPVHPVVRPTGWDRFLEGIAGLQAVALITLSIVVYLYSPEQIPIHFNYHGEADDWGSSALVFVLAGVGLISMGICAAAAYHREMVHMPIRLNPNVLPQQYAWVSRMCRVLTLCMGGVFLGIVSRMSPPLWHLASAGDTLFGLSMLLLLLVPMVCSVWIAYIGRRSR